MRWVAADPAELLWVHSEAGAVVLHRPSGKTHFLNEASVILLQGLTEAPACEAEAASWLMAGQVSEPGSLLIGQVTSILQRFEQLGLVRRRLK
jgi:PqqD family protein of HPr-rel-A system